MSPQVYQLGFISVRAFVFWIALGVFLSLAIVLILARRHHQRVVIPLDVALGAVIFALPFARAGHVILNWSYFTAHRDEIANLSSGGLDWHGALVGALIGVLIAGILRKLDMSAVLDRLALTFPILAATTWIACATSNAGYGIEVRSLADFPAWMVVESADVYGIVAPRLALANFGVGLAVLVGIVVILLQWRKWLRGGRLWLALIIYGTGMAVIGFFRAEYVPLWWGRRADQILDLMVVAGATIPIVIMYLRRWRLNPLPRKTEHVGAVS